MGHTPRTQIAVLAHQSRCSSALKPWYLRCVVRGTVARKFSVIFELPCDSAASNLLASSLLVQQNSPAPSLLRRHSASWPSRERPHTTAARTYGAQRLLQGPGTPLHSSQIPRLLDSEQGLGASPTAAPGHRGRMRWTVSCTEPSSSPVSCHQRTHAPRAHGTSRDLPMWAPCISTPCDFCSAIAILKSLLSRPGMFGIFLAALALSSCFASGFCAAGATHGGQGRTPKP
jgi:hypothetical protein